MQSSDASLAQTIDGRTHVESRSRVVVVHFLDSFEIGGTETNAIRLLERIDRRRFDIRVACLREEGPLLERVRRLGIPVEKFSIPSLMSVKAVREGRRLAAWLRANRVDVVHAHDVYSNIFAIPWARFGGVPLTISSRRWWGDHYPPRLTWLNRMSDRIAHRVLTNSDIVSAAVAKEGKKASAVLTIYNFVGEETFVSPSAEWIADRRREFGVRDGDTVLGIIANFHVVKDHATLLRAVAALASQHKSFKLVLVGDGVERERLVALAESLGISDRVVFAGRRQDAGAYHWLFDISLLSSLAEGFPNTIVEAMAAGRPVVATRVGGVADAVSDGTTGILTPPENQQEMSRAIARLLDNPALARAMGEEGRKVARARFHADIVVRQLEDEYTRALSAKT